MYPSQRSINLCRAQQLWTCCLWFWNEQYISSSKRFILGFQWEFCSGWFKSNTHMGVVPSGLLSMAVILDCSNNEWPCDQRSERWSRVTCVATPRPIWKQRDHRHFHILRCCALASHNQSVLNIWKQLQINKVVNKQKTTSPNQPTNWPIKQQQAKTMPSKSKVACDCDLSLDYIPKLLCHVWYHLKYCVLSKYAEEWVCITHEVITTNVCTINGRFIRLTFYIVRKETGQWWEINNTK